MFPLKLACMLIGPGIEQTLEYNCMHALIGKLLGLHHISPLLGLALYEAASVNQPGWISRVGRCGGSLSRACAKPGDVMQIRLLSYPPYYVFVFFPFYFFENLFHFPEIIAKCPAYTFHCIADHSALQFNKNFMYCCQYLCECVCLVLLCNFVHTICSSVS